MQELPDTAAYRRHAARLNETPMEMFNNVVSDPELFARYKAFSARDLQTENPIFWEHYTQLIALLPNPPRNPSRFTSPDPVPQHLVPAFLKIYTTFVLPNSPMELDLPGRIAQTVWGQMEPVRRRRPGVGVRRDVFVAVAQCVEAMIFDSVPRFLEVERDEYVRRRRVGSSVDEDGLRERRVPSFVAPPPRDRGYSVGGGFSQRGFSPEVERETGFERRGFSPERGFSQSSFSPDVERERERGFSGGSRSELVVESPRDEAWQGGDLPRIQSPEQVERGNHNGGPATAYGDYGRDRGYGSESPRGYISPTGRERGYGSEAPRGYGSESPRGFVSSTGRERGYGDESPRGYGSPTGREGGYGGESPRVYGSESPRSHRTPTGRERGYTVDSSRGYVDEREYRGESQASYYTPTERDYDEQPPRSYGGPLRTQPSYEEDYRKGQ